MFYFKIIVVLKRNQHIEDKFWHIPFETKLYTIMHPLLFKFEVWIWKSCMGFIKVVVKLWKPSDACQHPRRIRWSWFPISKISSIFRRSMGGFVRWGVTWMDTTFTFPQLITSLHFLYVITWIFEILTIYVFIDAYNQSDVISFKLLLVN